MTGFIGSLSMTFTSVGFPTDPVVARRATEEDTMDADTEDEEDVTDVNYA